MFCGASLGCTIGGAPLPIQSRAASGDLVLQCAGNVDVQESDRTVIRVLLFDFGGYPVSDSVGMGALHGSRSFELCLCSPTKRKPLLSTSGGRVPVRLRLLNPVL